MPLQMTMAFGTITKWIQYDLIYICSKFHTCRIICTVPCPIPLTCVTKGPISQRSDQYYFHNINVANRPVCYKGTILCHKRTMCNKGTKFCVTKGPSHVTKRPFMVPLLHQYKYIYIEAISNWKSSQMRGWAFSKV